MKDLPYFKFHVNEWLSGDVSVEDYEIQGVFIIIVSLYWSKEGGITEEFIRKRFREVPEIIDALLDARIMKLEEGNIVINFLDEQMGERKKVSKRNSNNGKKGGRPPKPKPLPPLEEKPPALVSVSETIPEQSNIEEKREEKKRTEKKKEVKKVAKAPIEKNKLKRFIKPTIEEIKKYCDERKNTIDAKTFFDHYETNGWKRGKTAIKDWKACVHTWENSRKSNNNGTTNQGHSKNSKAATHHTVEKKEDLGY